MTRRLYNGRLLTRYGHQQFPYIRGLRISGWVEPVVHQGVWHPIRDTLQDRVRNPVWETARRELTK